MFVNNDLKQAGEPFSKRSELRNVPVRPRGMSTARKLGIAAFVIAGLSLLVGLGVLGYGEMVEFTKGLAMADIAAFAVTLIAGVGGFICWLRSKDERNSSLLVSSVGKDANGKADEDGLPLFFFDDPKYKHMLYTKSGPTTQTGVREQHRHRESDMGFDHDSTFSQNLARAIQNSLAEQTRNRNNQNLALGMALSRSQPSRQQEEQSEALKIQDAVARAYLDSASEVRGKTFQSPKNDGHCLFNAVAYAAGIAVDPEELREETAEELIRIMTGGASPLKQYLTTQIEAYNAGLRSRSQRPRGCPQEYFNMVLSTTASADDWLVYADALLGSYSTPLFGGEIEILLLAQLDRFKGKPIICYSGGGGGRSILANSYGKGALPREVGSDANAIEAFKGSDLAIFLSNAHMHYGAFSP